MSVSPVLDRGCGDGLREELDWVRATLGTEVVAAEPVSPLRGLDHPRTAFRVSLADGRRVKLRRVREVEEAERLEGLLAALAPVGLPRVLGRQGRRLLLEWVPGAPFPIRDPRRIREAGALLGRIHLGGGTAARSPSAADVVGDEVARAQIQLAELVGAGRLPEQERVALLAAMTAALPAGPARGVVHGDFAPENLVIDASGAVRPVDNETLCVGVLDLDVARAWSRWCLDADGWNAFLAGYRRVTGRPCRDEDLFGWKVRTLIVSAWYRDANGLEGAAAAVDRLRRLGASLGWTRSPLSPRKASP